VISRGCDIQLPPRNPDLNSLDYLFWGMLKAKIYHQVKPKTLEELKHLIIDACNHLTAEYFACEVSNIGCCRGKNFEHIKNKN